MRVGLCLFGKFPKNHKFVSNLPSQYVVFLIISRNLKPWDICLYCYSFFPLALILGAQATRYRLKCSLVQKVATDGLSDELVLLLFLKCGLFRFWLRHALQGFSSSWRSTATMAREPLCSMRTSSSLGKLPVRTLWLEMKSNIQEFLLFRSEGVLQEIVESGGNPHVW